MGVETLGFFHDAIEFDNVVKGALLHETVRIQDGFNLSMQRPYIFRHGTEVVYQLRWSSSVRVNCREGDLAVTNSVSTPKGKDCKMPDQFQVKPQEI